MDSDRESDADPGVVNLAFEDENQSLSNLQDSEIQNNNEDGSNFEGLQKQEKSDVASRNNEELHTQEKNDVTSILKAHEITDTQDSEDVSINNTQPKLNSPGNDLEDENSKKEISQQMSIPDSTINNDTEDNTDENSENLCDDNNDFNNVVPNSPNDKVINSNNDNISELCSSQYDNKAFDSSGEVVEEKETNEKKPKMEVRHRKMVDFENEYRKEPEDLSVCTRLKIWVRRKCEKTSAKKIFFSNLPFIKMLRKYKRSNIVPDLIAGSTAGAMMIPQGMAFGALSTLPPIVGLYISLFAPLTYFFLGTSHQVSMGCIAVLSLMMADILDLYDVSSAGAAGGGASAMMYGTAINSSLDSNLTTVDVVDDMSLEVQAKRIEVACAVTFVVGVITIVLSKLGLGFVTCFMSNSLITSFTVGVSVHVFTSQLKNGLGLKIERKTGLFKLPKTWYAVCEHIPETNVATLIMWLICIVIIYLVKAQINERFKKKMKIPIPIELFMVIIGTVASYYLELNKTYQVKIVEFIPKGIPAPKIPDLNLAKDYIGDGILIAVVSYAQTVALAKTFGLMHQYEIDPDQTCRICKMEMFACGGANVICSLFSGYITAASVSRSMVVNGAGAKTQIQSLIACSIVLLVIVVLAPYFYYLPLCVLAAIIVVNLRGMFWKLTQLNPLRLQSSSDFTVWVVTFSVSVFVDVIPGLLAGIGVSFLLIIIATQKSPVTVKGIIEGTQQFRSTTQYHCVSISSDVKIVHINKPICFANADIFVQKVYQYTDINPIKEQKKLKNKATLNIEASLNNSNNVETKVLDGSKENIELKVDDSQNVMLTVDEESSLPNYIILDLSGVSFIDLMGSSALQLIIVEFESIGVKTLLTNVAATVYETLGRVGFLDKNGSQIYLTLNDAMNDIHSINNQGSEA